MARLRFGLLGALEVMSDGVRLPLGGNRRARLLAVVLVEADRVVPLPRLIDAVWDEQPPPTARTQVHKIVLGLRRLLGSQVLGSDPAGYRVRLDAGAELDVWEFAEHVRRADHAVEQDRLAEAVASARAGLRLWRGPALAGVGGSVVRAAAQRLDEQRLTLLERCLGWELELGQHARVIAELTELVSQYPLRERFRGLLMLALHQAGRQADALEVYEDGRRMLADELGLDPGAELRATHQRVLAAPDRVPRADRDACAPVPPRMLPYDVPEFTGRCREFDRLVDAGGSAGTVAICAIEGMAGVGKTALAVHAAHALAGRFPDGQVFLDLRGFTPGHAPTSPAEALETLLRAIGVPGARIPASLDERVAAWRTELVDRRTLVVLDNAASTEQVLPLVPASPGTLVLITSRRRLTGLPGATPIELDTLAEEEAVALVTTIVGAVRAGDEPAAVAELVELCGYLPLAIRIAAARLQRRPRWTVGWLVERLRIEKRRLAELTADTHNSATIAFTLSYQAIPPDRQGLFRLLGLHPGADIDPHAAAALADLDPDTTEAMLEQLVDEHLLQELTPGRYTLHDLLRAHARLCTESEDSEPARHDALTRLFDHYRYTAARAVSLLDPHEPNCRQRVPRPDNYRAPFPDSESAARDWLHRELPNLLAVGLHSGWPTHTCDLSATVWRYLEHQGRRSDAQTLHTHAVTVARTIADPIREANALRNLGRAYLSLGEFADAIRCFEQALALHENHGDLAGVVTVVNDLGIVANESGRYAEVDACCRQGLTICRRVNDRAGRIWLLMTLGNSCSNRGMYPKAGRCLHKALELSREIGHRDAESRALMNIGDVYTRLRRFDQALYYLESALERFREYGNRESEAMTLTNLAGVYVQLGDNDRAGRIFEQTLAFFQGTRNYRWQGATLRQLGLLHFRSGCHDQADRDFRQALELAQQIGMPFMEAEVLNSLGALARARHELAEAHRHHQRALTVASRCGQRHDEANAHRGLGHIHHDRAERRAAERHWRLALDLYAELRLPDAEELHTLIAGL